MTCQEVVQELLWMERQGTPVPRLAIEYAASATTEEFGTCNSPAMAAVVLISLADYVTCLLDDIQSASRRR